MTSAEKSGLNEVMGVTLARYRRDSGLSQEALAFECGLHPTYISQIERGLKSPTVRTLFKIAAALGIRVSVVMTEVERKVRP